MDVRALESSSEDGRDGVDGVADDVDGAVARTEAVEGGRRAEVLEQPVVVGVARHQMTGQPPRRVAPALDAAASPALGVALVSALYPPQPCQEEGGTDATHRCHRVRAGRVLACADTPAPAWVSETVEEQRSWVASVAREREDGTSARTLEAR